MSSVMLYGVPLQFPNKSDGAMGFRDFYFNRLKMTNARDLTVFDIRTIIIKINKIIKDLKNLKKSKKIKKIKKLIFFTKIKKSQNFEKIKTSQKITKISKFKKNLKIFKNSKYNIDQTPHHIGHFLCVTQRTCPFSNTYWPFVKMWYTAGPRTQIVC